MNTLTKLAHCRSIHNREAVNQLKRKAIIQLFIQEAGCTNNYAGTAYQTIMDELKETGSLKVTSNVNKKAECRKIYNAETSKGTSKEDIRQMFVDVVHCTPKSAVVYLQQISKE